MTEFVIECWYDIDDGWIAGEYRDEIVRCRDCKEFAFGDVEYATVDWCDYWGAYVESPDGYCAWGERRNDER